MKISNKLPHFSQPTLIIICNPTSGAFYMAHRDEIEKVADFRIEKLQYSDREDFGRLPNGGVYETGGRAEKEKVIQSKDFKEKFLEAAGFVSRNFGIKKLYLFSAKNISSFFGEGNAEALEGDSCGTSKRRLYQRASFQDLEENPG